MPERPRRGQKHGSDRSTNASEALAQGAAWGRWQDGHLCSARASLTPDEGERDLGKRAGRVLTEGLRMEWRREREKRLHFWGGLRGEKRAPAPSP